MGYSKSVLTTLLLVLTTSLSAKASVTIAEYEVDDHFWKNDHVSFDSGTTSCWRFTVGSGYSDHEPNGSQESIDSPVCRMLRVAERLRQKVGMCSYNEAKETHHETSSSIKATKLILGGWMDHRVYNGFKPEIAHNDCLCAKVVAVIHKNDGDPFAVDVFDSIYFSRVKYTLQSVSAEECASLFSSEEAKKTVRDAYEEFGF